MKRKFVLAAAAAALFVLTTASIPTNGIPTNGIPTNGIPTNGIPTNGIPTNGIPTNGANLDALENSLIFGNKAVHEALIGNGLTLANLTTSPLSIVWSDPASTLLLSYLWQDAHALGDDLVYTAPNGQTFRFYGNLGLCAGTWAAGSPLDSNCARWLSALFITQINQSGVHNLFSARGPSGRNIGPAMTSMAPAISSFPFVFGTHTPVVSLSDACASGTTGGTNCGWQPGYVGTGTPGSTVKITLATTEPTVMQVNQGIMGRDYPFAAGGSCFGAPPGCTDADVLGSVVPGVSNPALQFTVPPSGVFNVQWAPDARDHLGARSILPTMTAQVVGAGAVHFPADELDAFPAANREMAAFGIIFGSANIDPALLACEVRPAFGITEGPPTQLCLADNAETCTPCTRPYTPGQKHVIFPNAHLWLSSGWTSAQDYYAARSCSSNLSTCIANFEGYIDAWFFNPAAGRLTPPCLSGNADRDTTSPLPYPGGARTLHDADGCFIGFAPQFGFTATTFFPNYRDLGACAALGPQSVAACGRKAAPPDDDGGGANDDDDDD